MYIFLINKTFFSPNQIKQMLQVNNFATFANVTERSSKYKSQGLLGRVYPEGIFTDLTYVEGPFGSYCSFPNKGGGVEMKHQLFFDYRCC